MCGVEKINGFFDSFCHKLVSQFCRPAQCSRFLSYTKQLRPFRYFQKQVFYRTSKDDWLRKNKIKISISYSFYARNTTCQPLVFNGNFLLLFLLSKLQNEVSNVSVFSWLFDGRFITSISQFYTEYCFSILEIFCRGDYSSLMSHTPRKSFRARV